MKTEARLGLALVVLGILWFLLGTGRASLGWLGGVTAFWPLLLVGFGLDVVGRSTVPRVVFELPYTGVALAAMLLLGLLYPGAGRADATVRSLRLARDGAEQVTLHVAPGAADLDLTGRRGVDPLVTGDLRGSRVSLSERGRARRTIEVLQRGPVRSPALWSLEVSEAVPVDLAIDGGSGTVRLDLDRLELTRLRVDGGSGRTSVDLPSAAGARLAVDVELGSGGGELRVPPQARIDLDLDAGSGATTIAVSEGADVAARIGAGSGGLELDLPDAGRVRLVVEDAGSGSLDLPGWLERVSGDTNREIGVWQSRALATDATADVVVRIVHAGSGAILVR